VLRDPDDDAVIACAMTATARYIISGDGDLLALKKHNEIEILKVAEFLRRFG
jgi:predicted nucleic acid-binding protein